ncbi:hypothetical protein GS982_20195 [Rhodococcus hoagii]|nr:hypothetical protein [Prescottella equi]NKZ84519.1 hypothetical protein [Prescottella equi]
MAKMLGYENAGSACCRPHTKGDRRRNGAPRAAERRQVARWIDEYEEPPAVVDRACPKGGPGCSCGFPVVTEGS